VTFLPAFSQEAEGAFHRLLKAENRFLKNVEQTLEPSLHSPKEKENRWAHTIRLRSNVRVFSLAKKGILLFSSLPGSSMPCWSPSVTPFGSQRDETTTFKGWKKKEKRWPRRRRTMQFFLFLLHPLLSRILWLSGKNVVKRSEEAFFLPIKIGKEKLPLLLLLADWSGFWRRRT